MGKIEREMKKRREKMGLEELEKKVKTI